jgi:hypothetical protein
MKRSLPLLIGSAILFFISCKKDDAINTVTPVPGKDTPVLLTRLVLLDTTLTTPNDTIGIYQVRYDDKFRTSWLQFEEYGGQGRIVSRTTRNYLYQGTDSMVSRVDHIRTNIFPTSSNTYHDTTYFVFQDGKLMHDSTVFDQPFYKTTRYRYYNGMIEKNALYRNTNGNTTVGQGYYHPQFVNGNLVQQTDTSTDVNNPGSTFYVNSDYELGYLSNPDPFYRVVKPMSRQYLTVDDWTYWGPPSFVSPNLPYTNRHDNDSRTSTGSTSSSRNLSTYTYEFRPDGYPLVMRQFETELGSYFVYHKMLYYYNK